jgi:mRNA interferase RelE/StbE
MHCNIIGKTLRELSSDEFGRGTPSAVGDGERQMLQGILRLIAELKAAAECYRYLRYIACRCRLSADIRKRIDAKLMIYATNGSGNVKRLKGAGGCRLRIADWRVIFIEDARSITVVAVGNRREIYD